jgi:thioredoxin 2
MAESIKIVCTNCDAVNKLPSDKLNAGGVCGKCKKSYLLASMSR